VNASFGIPTTVKPEKPVANYELYQIKLRELAHETREMSSMAKAKDSGKIRFVLTIVPKVTHVPKDLPPR
jgi:hypothetical protein